MITYAIVIAVISHLSVGAHAVDEETFQSIMKYVFTFIEKEKQAENIVEKLCQRFRLAEEPRQWRDIAYCLSLLPFKSERSVKKLIEGLQFYRDKLHEEEVYNRFQEILAKVEYSFWVGEALLMRSIRHAQVKRRTSLMPSSMNLRLYVQHILGD